MMSAHPVSLALSHDVYEPSALEDAARQYTPYLAVTVVRSEKDCTYITFGDPQGGPPTGTTLDEFLNYLLDLSIRHKLAEA